MSNRCIDPNRMPTYRSTETYKILPTSTNHQIHVRRACSRFT